MNRNKSAIKKEVYAEYGLQFKSDKVFCDPLGIWVPEMIPVNTNTKVGNAGTWSLYHGDELLTIDMFGPKTRELMEIARVNAIKASCPLHCKDCYCDNGNYRFDGTKRSLMLKLILATYHIDWLERAIKACIKANNIKKIRIHAAGDFFSDEYIDMWKRIVNEFNTSIFWTYTKNDYALKQFDGIDNLFITPSITPAGFNFGTCAEILYKYNKLTSLGYKVHICACGTPIEKELDIHCATCEHGCKSVGKECDFVLFIKHSTKDYKAGKNDPKEFELVCNIVRNQNN